MDSVFNKNVSKRLKSLLIILMFWGHMFNHPERLWEGITWKSLISIQGTPIEVLLCPFFHISVPLFFFISGYGFYLTYKNGLDKKKLLNQVKNLYKRYWLVFAVCMPICFALGRIKFIPGEFILNLIGVSSSYCGEWWFLSTYLEILILFWVVAKVFSQVLFQSKEAKNDIIVLAVSIVIATFGYGFKFLLERRGIDTERLFIHEVYFLLIKQPFFVVGFICAKRSAFDKITAFIRNLPKLPRYITAIVLLVALIIIPYINAIPETYIYFVYLPIFVLLFCYFDRMIPTGIQMMFLKTSDYTTYMWLLHSMLLYKFIQPIIYMPKWSVLCWIVLIVLSVACAVMFSIMERRLVYMSTSIKNDFNKKK